MALIFDASQKVALSGASPRTQLPKLKRLQRVYNVYFYAWFATCRGQETKTDRQLAYDARWNKGDPDESQK